MINDKTLKLEYIKNQLTTKQIAAKYKIGATTVKRLLQKYKIKPNFKKRNKKPSKLTKEYLQEHYTLLGKSCIEIANEVGCSKRHVSLTMNKYNIEKRKCGSRLGKPNKKSNYKGKSLIGNTYGDLKVEGIIKGGWVCLCKCGNTKIYRTRRLTHDKVKSCGCRKTFNGKKHHLWKGYGDIPMSLYKKCYHHAITRKLEFNISIEDLWDIYLAKDGKCYISGVNIGFIKGDITASIDRIDSSKGYTKDNVQWVHKIVNQMKWNFKQQELIEWCKIIAKNNP